MNRDLLAERLRAIFLVELEDQLQALNDNLLALEAAPDAVESLLSLFRIVHTLKGAAHAAHVPQVENVCHSLETLLARAREGKLTLGPGAFSLLFSAADALAEGRDRLREGRDLVDSPVTEMAHSLRAFLAEPVARPLEETAARLVHRATASAPALEPFPDLPPAPAPTKAEFGSEPVRVEAEKLDALLASAGQLLAIAGRVTARPAELDELHERITRWSLAWRRTARRLRHLLRDVRLPASVQHELEEVEENLRRMDGDTGRVAAAAREDARDISKAADEIGDRIRRLRLRPFSDACIALPRAVRDLATSSGKEVRLVINGGEVQADRAVLNVLHEVLLHLVRNAVDHGIEPPEERVRAGKPRVGSVILSAMHQGQRLTITAADDGRGVDLDAVRRKLERGGQQVPGPPEELARALFRPGFSTRAEVTAISGRGVGLDVVRTTIERIRGSVQVSWEEGRGTTFVLECPPSLATIRALLISVGSQLLAIPTGHVEHLVRLRPEEIRTAEGRDVILTSEGPVPLVSLARLMGPPLRESALTGPFLVVRLLVGGRRLALAVDDLLAEEEIVVRPLNGIRGPSLLFSGASLLGTGRVVLVLNPSAAVDAGLTGTPAGPALREIRPLEPARKRILLVDDSVTTRALEQSILEAAGYQVLTGVDGSNAWQMLQEKEFDLVVSDVEMPRMDGFELCAAIRASNRLSGIPVVLVTGLEAPEHRMRGLEAGADAYLPKSSFDQKYLLETIQQLIG